MKGFAHRLTLTLRQKATQKWPFEHQRIALPHGDHQQVDQLPVYQFEEIPTCTCT